MTKSHYRSLVGVAVAIAAGLIVAFHMGKVPGALPYLIETFDLSLSESGLIVSAFSLLAAVSGALFGLVIARVGVYLSGLFGLLITGVGAMLGAGSDTYMQLLGSRVAEGIGFVLVAVSMPSLINRICPENIRPVAMGVWGAFIPAAMCLMLAGSPVLLAQNGWQTLWVVTGLLTLVWMIVFGVMLKSSRQSLVQRNMECIQSKPRINEVLQSGPITVVAVFICYSALFAAVTTYLPAWWHGNMKAPLAEASRMASVAVAGNIVGNIIAGMLTGKGVRFRSLSLIALLAGSACAATLFTGLVSLHQQYVLAFLFTLFAGMLPGAVFANLPDITTNPAAIPLLTGLIFQGAGIGQLLGPVGFANATELSGSWFGGGLFVLTLGIAGGLISMRIVSAKPAYGASDPQTAVPEN